MGYVSYTTHERKEKCVADRRVEQDIFAMDVLTPAVTETVTTAVKDLCGKNFLFLFSLSTAYISLKSIFFLVEPTYVHVRIRIYNDDTLQIPLAQSVCGIALPIMISP